MWSFKVYLIIIVVDLAHFFPDNPNRPLTVNIPNKNEFTYFCMYGKIMKAPFRCRDYCVGINSRKVKWGKVNKNEICFLMCDLLTTNLATKLKFLPIGSLYFVLLIKSFPAEKLKIRGRSWAMKDQFNSIQPKLYTT